MLLERSRTRRPAGSEQAACPGEDSRTGEGAGAPARRRVRPCSPARRASRGTPPSPSTHALGSLAERREKGSARHARQLWGRARGNGGMLARRVASRRMTWSRTLRAACGRAAAEALRRTWEWGGFAAAVGPDHPRARRFAAFGDGTLIAFPFGTVYNERYIELGAGTMIGPYVSLAAGMAPGQDMLTSPVVRIGDRCVIGRGSHVVGHWSIDIGDDVQTGPYVYVTDQNHSYEDPDQPIGRQCPVEAGVSIGAGSWLGANAVVLPGARIGCHVVVAAGAVVRGVVPDRCVVAGVPARVVRRWLPDRGWVDEDRTGTVSAGDPPVTRR